MTTLTEQDVTQLDRLAELLFERRSGVAFTGAGISTESGIPDYRGPDGIWKKIKPTMFRDFVTDPEIRLNHWKRRVERYPELAAKQPNDGHRALARMQQLGFLQEIITQNIDGLHQKAGSDPENVIELHGSAHRVRCLQCGRLFDAEPFDREFNGEEPICPVCGGIVKESTISFGQSLVADDLRRSLLVARGADVMIVVGSSLTVNPAAKVPREAVKAGAELAIINNQPTPLDDLAKVVVRSQSGPSLSYLADRLIP
ncbi:MAG: Sir2 family NAD-dependent protein deacetylase [Nitrolancea sp.]